MPSAKILEKKEKVWGRCWCCGAGRRGGRRRSAAWHAGRRGRAAPGLRAAPIAPQYDAKLCDLMDTYERAFLVHADNVGSKQFMDIRAVRRRLWGHQATDLARCTDRRPRRRRRRRLPP